MSDERTSLPSHLSDHLALALEAGGLGAWEWDLVTGEITWDETLERIYGLAPGTFDGSVDTYRSMIHPADREDAARAAEAGRATRAKFETEHRVVRPDGSVRWTHGWAQPLVAEDGTIRSYIGVVMDITERRAAVDDLRRALEAESAARAEAEAARIAAELAAHRYADIALTLQRSLLPPVPPQIPGLDIATCYHPALDGLAVGGDFYDIARLGRSTWGLMLGDVCGKGAAAAALTALTRYAARAAATQDSRPAAVLRQVNETLRHDTSRQDADSTFATMIFARLRPRPGELEITLASAGHPLPYVIRANGDVERPGRHGVMLGVVPDVRLANAKVTLRPGDTFLVVTDGVLEARDRHGRELDEELPRLLSATANDAAAKTVGAIEQAALDWQGGTPTDDIAVVAVRVPNVA